MATNAAIVAVTTIGPAAAAAGCGGRSSLDTQPAVDAAAPEAAGPACSSQTCSGCCDDAGACLPGTAQAACGEQGRACAVCDPNHDLCNPDPHNPDGNVCFAPCDPRFCQGGCCMPDGHCVGGTADDACGSVGYLCLDCTSRGETCGVSDQRRTCVPD